MSHPLPACGHGVPIGCYCAPCRSIDAESDIPAEGNPREPQADERLSRWPRYLSPRFLRAWAWPSDAEGIE